jgi:magnesium chelatase family protein
LRGKLLEKYCRLGAAEQELLDELTEGSQLSLRGVHRMLRVARTLADMEESEAIEERHLLQAATYKMAGNKYWRGDGGE